MVRYLLTSTVALLTLASCERPAAEPVVVAQGPSAVLLDCGDREASATFAGDSAVAIIDGQRVVLRRVASASGARYADPADSTTMLWNHAPETTVTIRGDSLPTCVEAAQAPFIARGNEPGWMLTLDSAAATLVHSYGADTVSGAVTSRKRMGATTVVEAGLVSITVRDEPCADASTGMPHPAAVSVTTGSTTLTGCGGNPASLLQGEEWTVVMIGSDTTQAPAPTLTFFRSGRVAGSTSCNRLSGSYTVGGEGLSLGPAATTKRACGPPAGEQESRFLDAWGRVSRFEVAGAGLTLFAGDAPVVTAVRTSALRP